MSQTDNIVTLNDENGNEIRFEFLDLIELEGREYVVLLPVEDCDGEVTILQIEETSDEDETYSSVEDEETLMKVFKVFKNKHKDQFDFAD